ncbi:MAG: amino acid transporter [Limisphaerales bacterium]|nr:MAG: amino acid transporter [Limisphaerales bacterium]KAG0509707.1 MAG: amino acid transporter [Limisphaerales bacterium]TXT51174.1 MAG: amino acid transporter [Limisphaerales bacterium]
MNHPDDEKLLRQLGYEQELSRRMSGFSNFAISLSIICILAGGITSFHVGLCSAGGASIGLGWPLVCLFSLCVAATMAQVASAFPTAGGLYHWGSILGGRACGWVTAWFNLAGLITVLAAINAGTYDFATAAFGVSAEANTATVRTTVIVLMTLSQGLLNHYGIHLTTRLTDLSGYLILAVATVLTVALLVATKQFEWARLWTFTNFSGLPEGGAVFPKQDNLMWLFALGFLLPAYTITGFDASAHTSEETVGAAMNVPKGIVRSVWVSGVFGWVMICAILLAMPSVKEGVEQGANVVPWTMKAALPDALASVLLALIIAAQYLCGLAALTSASRMTYAFARDGGLPFSDALRRVNPASKSPSVAVWFAAIAAALFTILVPYVTIAAVCVIFLYISYALPVAAGFLAHGRTWTRMGPWQIGRLYRPLAVVSVLGCLFLIVIGMQPPNEQAVKIVGGTVVLLLAVWFGLEKRRFKGPPEACSVLRVP